MKASESLPKQAIGDLSISQAFGKHLSICLSKYLSIYLNIELSKYRIIYVSIYLCI
jgi:hypothetical protein